MNDLDVMRTAIRRGMDAHIDILWLGAALIAARQTDPVAARFLIDPIPTINSEADLSRLMTRLLAIVERGQEPATMTA